MVSFAPDDDRNFRCSEHFSLLSVTASNADPLLLTLSKEEKTTSKILSRHNVILDQTATTLVNFATTRTLRCFFLLFHTW